MILYTNVNTINMIKIDSRLFYNAEMLEKTWGLNQKISSIKIEQGIIMCLY